MTSVGILAKLHSQETSGDNFCSIFNSCGGFLYLLFIQKNLKWWLDIEQIYVNSKFISDTYTLWTWFYVWNIITRTWILIPSCFWWSHPRLPPLMQHQIHPYSYTPHPQHHCVRIGHNQTPGIMKMPLDTVQNSVGCHYSQSNKRLWVEVIKLVHTHTHARTHNFPVYFMFPTVDLIQNVYKYNGIYSIVFPICTVLMAVKAMCKYS